MKVAITGSSGFIGVHLLKRLRELDYEIVELDVSKGFDTTDWNSVKELSKFDVCVHLAAKSFVPESYTDTRVFYNINMIGTLNMLEICRIHHAKFIFTSSYVYGKPDYLPVDENHKLSAFNPYAHSKIIGEELCGSYSKFLGVSTIIFRPFNIYGYGQNSNFLIPEIIEKAFKSEVVELLDATPRRDMVYVADLTDAYVAAIETNLKNEIFNIGSGGSYSVEQIAQIIFKYLGRNNRVIFKNQKRINEVNDVIADISKAKKLLNWKPKTSIENGIRETVNLFRNRGNNK